MPLHPALTSHTSNNEASASPKSDVTDKAARLSEQAPTRKGVMEPDARGKSCADAARRWGAAFGARARSDALEPAGQRQNQDDQQDQAQTAARIVAPARTVGPRR